MRKLARFDALSSPARMERVAGLLRAERSLLVLDNAESITAHPAAIPHALDETERAHLARLLSRLRGGRTLVLLGSREAEAWVAPQAFGRNVYDLPGLDPQAASMLVDRILELHGGVGYLKDPVQRRALDELVTLLGRYPLPLTVVLPMLGSHPPTQVLADLTAGGQDADPMSAIRRSIEYSHGKLDPTIRRSLLLLAPFTATIPGGELLAAYQRLLAEHEAVAGREAIDLAAAVAEAVRVGLATLHPQLQHYVQVLPVLPYFLRTRLPEHADLHTAASQAHYQLYQDIGNLLHQMLTSHTPHERATGQVATQAEYANLTTALRHGLTTAQPITGALFALAVYLQHQQQLSALRRLLDDAITAHHRPETPPGVTELATLYGFAGRTALDQHRLDDATKHYHKELELRRSIDDRQAQGIIHHQLGMVAQEQRRFTEAEAQYRQALEINLEFGNRHSAARTYHQLGRVALEQRRFAEAEAQYRQALEINLEFGDRHSAASTYHQLGELLIDADRHAEATPALLSAVVTWFQSTGAWATNGLNALRQVRRHVAAEAFDQAVTNVVPAELTQTLIAALDGSHGT